MDEAGSAPNKPGERKGSNPLWLNAEITFRCPLHCIYCYNPVDYAHSGPELTTEDWLRVLREARELGAVRVGRVDGRSTHR
jgi:pyrroloquinoline quinone biosynthesis protein E